jgi:hypothetical protein
MILLFPDFSRFFSIFPPNSRGTPADPSRHTSVPRHNRWKSLFYGVSSVDPLYLPWD